jgi:hypothetical protein
MSKMATLKLVLKHVGSSLVSNLQYAPDKDYADREIARWMRQWRDVDPDRDTGWFQNEEGMQQRDLLWYPIGQEPFLFRFTYEEIGVVPELDTAAVATRLNAGSSPVHASRSEDGYSDASYVRFHSELTTFSEHPTDDI